MKKLVLTIAVVLGMTFGASAQHLGDNEPQAQRGLFGRGNAPQYEGTNADSPMLPHHGESTNQNANTPLGSGALLLIGFGTAYAASKRRKE